MTENNKNNDNYTEQEAKPRKKRRYRGPRKQNDNGSSGKTGVKNYIRGLDTETLIDSAREEIVRDWQSRIEKYLSHRELYVRADDPNSEIFNPFSKVVSLNKRSISAFLRSFEPASRRNCIDRAFLQKVLPQSRTPERIVCDMIRTGDDRLQKYLTDKETRSYAFSYLMTEIEKAWPRYEAGILRDLRSRFDPQRVLQLLKKNPHYRQLTDSFARKLEQEAILNSMILRTIPDRFVDLYPKARQLRRHFILHIGVTNSGKTHQAIEALKKAQHGIYLGPLRLLAYEQYERLNAAGVPCRLVTGEERQEVENARVQASTVEVADLEDFYDVAVIDEAQMLSDESRGGAWVSALMGLCAREIHVCAAPYAERILLNLIRECRDEAEIVRHERMADLVLEKEPFAFPGDVQKGDVLIVFSKGNVHGVASELQARKKNCSVIYGSLPYDVRHNEAQRFSAGETDIVVATDAIGMGMNLPVRRVIFLEDTKFDGRNRRLLKPEEVTQIAGRAGRYGLYDTGYVNAPEEVRDHIYASMEAYIPPIRNAVVRFPETLVDIDARLSDLISRWMEMEDRPGFVKQDMAAQQKLLRLIENETDDKHLLYRLIMIPFDEEDAELVKIWKEIALSMIWNTRFDERQYIPLLKESYSASELSALEHLYEICDLIYYYVDNLLQEDASELMEVKRQISMHIIHILETSRLQPRKCRRCGRRLAWNHPFGICSQCWEKTRRS